MLSSSHDIMLAGWPKQKAIKGLLKTEFKVNAQKASDSNVKNCGEKNVTWLKFEMWQFWGEDVMSSWEWYLLKRKRYLVVHRSGKLKCGSNNNNSNSNSNIITNMIVLVGLSTIKSEIWQCHSFEWKK